MQRTAGVEAPFPYRVKLLNELGGALQQFADKRLVIAGGPRVGKSTVSRVVGSPRVRGTDELIGLGWSEASEAASKWFDEPGPWLCEGVAMPRALRKWLGRNSAGAPADLVIWIGEPVVARVAGQDAMAAGCLTVWREIRGEIARRGTLIREI